MRYQALLFCPDDKTARVVTQVLSELEFQVECCNEPFAAVKKLMAQHFDAIVVDCENEQNASLLFKSARNSGSNASALSVAVVEGQAGVAKAFRIGANLVLTRPINVEQSKGTLRVARGLLRKAEAAKPVATAPDPSTRIAEPSAAQPFSSAPSVMPSGPSQQVPIPTASASGFELEAEPDVKPDAAEATLLEYMPDVPTSPAQTVSSHAPKEFPWQPISKHGLESVASALPSLAEATRRAEPQSDTTSKVAPVPTGGAAAAPAPAKEVADPEIVPFESKPIWPARPEADFEINSTSGRSRTEAPVFSSLSGIEAQQESGSGGATRKFVFVLLAAGLVIGGYFGWSKMHAGSHPAVVQEPSAVVRPAPSVMPPAPLPPEEQSASTPPKQVEVSESPAQQPEEVSVDPNPKPARAKPTPAIINTAPASKEPVPAKPQPIVVKNDFSRQTKWEAALPPAPAPLSIASAPNDQALTSIVAAPVHVPNPVKETLKVSQGVSQGLLVKRVQPVYPPQARQMHLEGTVQLLAGIRKDGSISGVKQLSGDAILGRAAIDAVRQWKYKPYFLNGEPVEIQTQITVNFKLP